MVGVLAICTAVPQPAEAITKRRADTVAKRVLKPGLGPRRQAILFGLRRPLRAGTRIGEGGPRRSTRIATVRRPVWLYWLDLAPSAAFGHRSVLLVIDDRTAKAVLVRELGWWPLVNGRRLPWHRSDAGYRARRTRVAVAAAAAARLAPPLARLSQAPPAPARFANDCLITVGDRGDHLWRGTFTTIEAVAARIGLRLIRAEQPGDVEDAVKRFRRARPRCTDIAIFIAGHGSRRRGTPGAGAESDVAETTTSVESSSGGRRGQSPITSRHLRTIFNRNRKATFKLLVSSCYSGRWIDDLEDAPNLRIAVAGAQSDQVEFRTDDATEASGQQTNGRPSKDGPKLRDTTTNPDDAFDFANGIARGLESWADDPAAQEASGGDLGKGIGAAFGRQREQNFAEQLGWQTGRVADHTDERPEPEPTETSQAPAGPSGEGSFAFAPGQELFFSVSFGGPAEGFAVEVPQGRAVTAHIAPRGFTCEEGGARLTCRGSVTAGAELQGRLRTAPEPSAAMGGTLYAVTAAGTTRAGAIRGP